MVRDYEKNPYNWELDWKDKEVNIYGKVVKIPHETNELGQYRVDLGGHGGGSDRKKTLTCYFNDLSQVVSLGYDKVYMTKVVGNIDRVHIHGEDKRLILIHCAIRDPYPHSHQQDNHWHSHSHDQLGSHSHPHSHPHSH